MEIEKYREIIKSIVKQYSEDDGDDREVETQTAIDIQSDRYMMFHIGWRGKRRVFGLNCPPIQGFMVASGEIGRFNQKKSDDPGDRL